MRIWPVSVPGFKEGQTDINLLYLDEVNEGTVASMRVPNNDAQAQELLNLVKNISFYKKIIQPSGVESYSDHTKEIQLFIYTTLNGHEKVFVLQVVDNGTVLIKPDTSKQFIEYGIGYPGKRQEHELFEQLYKFYQNSLINGEWKSGNS